MVMHTSVLYKNNRITGDIHSSQCYECKLPVHVAQNSVYFVEEGLFVVWLSRTRSGRGRTSTLGGCLSLSLSLDLISHGVNLEAKQSVSDKY